MPSRNFIEHNVFDALIREIPRVDGGAYEDLGVIYSDMSRLVVAWIANTPTDELQRLYTEFGWGGHAGVRPMQLAAQKWMRENRPEGLRA